MTTLAPDLGPQVRAAAAGDADAYSRLVRAWMSTVGSIALAITRDPVAADDVVQNVFLVAWRRLPQLRNPRSFGGWLRQIARSESLDLLRSRRRRGRLLDVDDDAVAAAAGDDAMEHILEREEQRVLEEALAALPDDGREVLVLFYREGRSVRQVALLLGLSEAAVKKRLSRARAALREGVEERLAVVLPACAPGAEALAAVEVAVAGQAQSATALAAVSGVGGMVAALAVVGALILGGRVWLDAPRGPEVEVDADALTALIAELPPPDAPQATVAAPPAVDAPKADAEEAPDSRAVVPVDQTLEEAILDAIRGLPEDQQDIDELAVDCEPSGDPCVLSGQVAEVRTIPTMLRGLASEMAALGARPALFQPLPTADVVPLEDREAFAIKLSLRGRTPDEDEEPPDPR